MAKETMILQWMADNSPAVKDAAELQRMADKQAEKHQQQNTYTVREFSLQAKLTVSDPGDSYEQEADRVAASIMSLLDSPVGAQK